MIHSGNLCVLCLGFGNLDNDLLSGHDLVLLCLGPMENSLPHAHCCRKRHYNNKPQSLAHQSSEISIS